MGSLKMTAIILAGGKSSRLGYDKAFIKIKGASLIKRQLNTLKKLFKNLIIVTNNPDNYRFKGIKVIPDIIPNRGPLSGIYSGLMASNTLYNFVLACDMPFINSELIKYMIKSKDKFDAVVPKLKKGYETLFAIYSRNCLPIIYETINKNNFKVRNIFSKIKLKKIGEQEISKFGDPGILFMNINTKDDLCKISTYLRK